ncbi:MULTISPECIES: hypothetical protein [unclassified Streptomyces]|uniref:hypothetical protein n=1 Tax=unclassified Streptomyces TaxID=2593676 RepID=UPI00225B6FDC|nr:MULTISPECIES: hypothetical protein [unclassified Streptomyces]MCX5013590.1 hypothetical protein [Streptomyces sp. NBC_00555]MCX5607611.1 hypothetical protein [Streptomyces sp. NBC_00047]
MKTQRRVSAAVVALLLGGAGIAISASPALAAEATFKVKCVPPAGGGDPVEGETTAKITAPATAKVGDEVDVVWETVKPASNNTDLMDIPQDSVQPTGWIAVGGGMGELKVVGEKKNPPIPKKAPMVMSPMKGKLKLTKAGKITLTPGKYDVAVTFSFGTFVTKCAPTGEVKGGATIDVSAGSSGGTTSGGTTSGGTTTGGATTGGSTTGGGSTTTSGGSTTGGGGGQTDFPGKAVEVAFDCGPVVPGGIKTPVTINAKKNGGSYDLTVKTAKGAMAAPMALPAGALKPSMNVKLGGADSGTVKVSGPANAEPIPDKAPVSLNDMTGTYKPGKTGKVTLSPDQLTIDVTMAPGSTPINVPCKATSSGVSLELDTAAQPGGSGSATTTGTSTSGGLAETGAEDEGGIKALALVAGTVILLGAGVFTFTPWRRLRGTR